MVDVVQVWIVGNDDGEMLEPCSVVVCRGRPGKCCDSGTLGIVLCESVAVCAEDVFALEKRARGVGKRGFMLLLLMR